MHSAPWTGLSGWVGIAMSRLFMSPPSRFPLAKATAGFPLPSPPKYGAGDPQGGPHLTSPLKSRESLQTDASCSPTKKRCWQDSPGLAGLPGLNRENKAASPAGGAWALRGPGDASERRLRFPRTGVLSPCLSSPCFLALPSWDGRPGACPRAGSGPRCDLASVGRLWPRPLRASQRRSRTWCCLKI